MPYIKPNDRQKLDAEIEDLIAALRYNKCGEGDLNYTISRLLKAAWEFKPCYATANGLVGVMECAKTEFYRRTLAPYEDKKIIENGDI